MKIEKIKLAIEGMTCDQCASSIEKELNGIDGVLTKEVSYPDSVGIIEYDGEAVTKEVIIDVINSTHYKVTGEISDSKEEASLSGSEKLSDNSSEDYDFDLIIIGGGSAAFSAALKASELGKKTLMINDGLPIGGTCVNVGCVPSKTLIRTAEAFHNANHPNFTGIIPGENKINFKEVIEQKRELVEGLRQKKYIDVIEGDENITRVKGRASVADEHTVAFNGERKSAENILIASGSSPFIPEIPGLDSVPYFINDTLYELETLPEHLVIIGGRYIAMENAQLFARLGSKVTLLQRSNRIIPNEMPDISETLADYLKEEGVNIRTGVKINEVLSQGDKVTIDFEINGEREITAASHLLVAAGRKGNGTNMGLESLGIELFGNGFIKTDEYNRTSVKNIYAAGDVTGEHLFVYTAAYAGALAVKNAFDNESEKKDFSVLPWVIFTDPQVAGVGMDENQAYENKIDYDTATLWLKDVPRALAARNTKGFIKLIRDKSTNKLIGARILASEGSELLMEISLAIKYGITIDELRKMFHPYLTLSEGVKLAAITFDKDVDKLSCCAV